MIREARRYNVVCCGRRFGKSTLGLDRVVPCILKGQPAAWFSPTYKMLEEVWRDAARTLRPVTARVNVQQHRLELLTGGVLDMWSLDTPDGPRGRKYARVVVDEAAMVPDLQETWQAVIRPTLADLAGDAWFLSTPRGANFFRTMHEYGRDLGGHPEWMSWQMPTFANPYIPVSEIEAMRRDMTERRFAQEVMAEFLPDAGGVFRNVTACATVTAPEAHEAHDGHIIVVGVDWAKASDFTVITALCGTCRRVVDWDRFNQIDYILQRQRLAAMCARWRPAVIYAESNSIGEPNIELLRSGETLATGDKLPALPVRGFETTATTKPPLIESLVLAIERGDLAVPKAYAGELQAYEMKRNANTGHPSFSAPPGLNDDCVMSLALAWHGAHRRHAGGIAF